MTKGGPFEDNQTSIGSTDLLITYAYRLAIEGTTPNFGFAAAISVFIFIIVGAVPPRVPQGRSSRGDQLMATQTHDAPTVPTTTRRGPVRESVRRGPGGPVLRYIGIAVALDLRALPDPLHLLGRVQPRRHADHDRR